MKNRVQIHKAASKFNSFSERQRQAFIIGVNYITKEWYDAQENPPTEEYRKIVVIDINGDCKVANLRDGGIECDWFVKWMPLPV